MKKLTKLPIIISGTITDASGRILSGQTPTAFWHSIKHANPISVGFNCALGADSLKPYIRKLSDIAEVYTSIHPNAGIPNELGQYEHTPKFMSEQLFELAQNKHINIVGGCCGTTPHHIESIVKSVSTIKNIRPLPKIKPLTNLSGLETLSFNDVTGFVNIGDIVNLVQYILGDNLSKGEDPNYIDISYNNNFISIESDGKIAGLQLEYSGEIEINNKYGDEDIAKLLWIHKPVYGVNKRRL